MEYTLELIFSALTLVCLFYVIRQWLKGIKHNKLSTPITPMPLADDDPYGDFMCILKADGSTLASSGGVVIRGRRLK